ncbi:type VII secretion target [Nocardia carnea]|uniref:Type VII secretion target n=1 Tax=Nocardia carnea TaxID=37328 RepID=A0ABW7TJF3_9NOCA|nr:type VII secretion target [Nocardia carnea]
MTEQPAPLNVDPDQLRTHANKLSGLADRTATALEAAAYIAAADDGFGAIPRPIVSWLFADNHTATVDAIRKLADRLAAVPGMMNADADSFQNMDEALSTTLSGLRLGDGPEVV